MLTDLIISDYFLLVFITDDIKDSDAALTLSYIIYFIPVVITTATRWDCTTIRSSFTASTELKSKIKSKVFDGVYIVLTSCLRVVSATCRTCSDQTFRRQKFGTHSRDDEEVESYDRK